jgi:hypothetical protein
MRGLLKCLLLAGTVVMLAGCPGKPEMTLNEFTHHFVQSESSWAFKIMNTGKQNSELTFSIITPPGKPWLSVTPETGVVQSGDTADITVAVNWAYSTKAAIESFRTAVLQINAQDQDENDLGFQEVTVTTASNYFTAEYATAEVNALEGNHYTFTPDGSMNYYGVSAEKQLYQFATKPEGGQIISFDGDTPIRIDLTTPILFYGTSYSSVWVSRTGTISFNAPGNPAPQTLTAHFADIRVCPLSSMDAGSANATASYKVLSDRVVFTFEDAATLGTGVDPSGTNTVQVELYGDGRVVIAYVLLNPSTSNAIIGLSNAPPTLGGVPVDFVASKLPAAQ